MTTGTTLVIGATGATGSRTVAQLTATGYRVKAASRHATPVPGAEPVAFDWYDHATHAAALDGADRVYLIPPRGVRTATNSTRRVGPRSASPTTSPTAPVCGPVVSVTVS
ncbi:hypothetical protein M271_50005 [Streptomyces rapamycinicus NRRL 5491]|uniref:NAD(P)-binding domain-containing protein n=2 Tax=Streptomyces rapamycinicus TaxID=1226757 RepID=A0A0A0NP37_STRRN|nr:hypothetical protein M271_50005 [Streptomyces rapamycinicus NRRL 5491]MBB4787454.1 uncharacterized protein YbjT (DUF2867 family) [Streptomyces rapamycinicus]RLV71799.1 hypothetical protein D3C57_144770 [Streptomyces rapamycinicus NRRL 5491]